MIVTLNYLDMLEIGEIADERVNRKRGYRPSDLSRVDRNFVGVKAEVVAARCLGVEVDREIYTDGRDPGYDLEWVWQSEGNSGTRRIGVRGSFFPGARLFQKVRRSPVDILVLIVEPMVAVESYQTPGGSRTISYESRVAGWINASTFEGLARGENRYGVPGFFVTQQELTPIEELMRFNVGFVRSGVNQLLT